MKTTKPEELSKNEHVKLRLERDLGELFLKCDKCEFRKWLKIQYPHVLSYRSNPRGATFGINFSYFDFTYKQESKRNRYHFYVVDFPDSKLGLEVFGAIRNEFELPTEQVDTVKLDSSAAQVDIVKSEKAAAIVENSGLEAAAQALRERANELGISPKRCERWNQEIQFNKTYMTQESMVKRLGVCLRTIAQDFHDMKKKGLLP